jgi:hypothetical protein
LSGFTFRIRLPKATSANIMVEAPSLILSLGDEAHSLVVASGSEDIPLSRADTYYVTSADWPDEQAALAAADRCMGALLRTFARMRLGIDTGARLPGGGGFSKWLIDKVWEEQRIRVINEAPGVMVFETDPPPRFASATASVQQGFHENQVIDLFASAVEASQPLTPEESVALVLFNAAYFQQSQDARFTLRMMSLESMLRPEMRSPAAQRHLDQLVALTERAAGLSDSECTSLCSAIASSKHESIRQAGRQLVSALLGAREYSGKPAAAFFSHCYALRSRLVHGSVPLPSSEDIGGAAVGLELLMSDVLAGGLREVTIADPSG